MIISNEKGTTGALHSYKLLSRRNAWPNLKLRYTHVICSQELIPACWRNRISQSRAEQPDIIIAIARTSPAWRWIYEEATACEKIIEKRVGNGRAHTWTLIHMHLNCSRFIGMRCGFTIHWNEAWLSELNMPSWLTYLALFMASRIYFTLKTRER